MIQYPKVRKSAVQDLIFGKMIDDPYRWLEDDRSLETAQFVNEQNAVTQAYLEQIPDRDKIRKRLADLYNYEKYALFHVHRERIFYNYNTGLQNQPAWFTQKGLDSKAELLLDPNTLSREGTTAVTFLTASKDGRFLPYLLSEAGSDWQTLKIIDLENNKTLEDELHHVKFTETAWEGNGFYYSRYDAPQAGSELSGKNENMKICFHVVGTLQEEDALVYEDPANPTRYFRLSTTKDEKHRLIHVSEGTDGTEILIFDHEADGFVKLFSGLDANRQFVGQFNHQLLFLTDENTPNQKIVTWNPDTKELKDLIPEESIALKNAVLVGENLILEYLEDVASKVIVFNISTGEKKEIALPGLGSVLQISGSEELGGFLYSFGSLLAPISLYFYDFANGVSNVFKQSKLAFDASDFITERHFVEASDGSMIPLFLTYKKGLRKDALNPTLLFAYGGFSISLPLSFNPSHAYLIEQGGIYAQANIRGGAEYGDAWHKAGMLLNKQRVFDDFRECAEYLIEHQFCSRETLAIEGRSNGGLLMGAVMNQHPELYRVVFPTVGVMDMLRYHLFTIGWGWIPEYGNPDEEIHFNNILRYSPLHNIEEKKYPSVMIMTADHDDRVVPAHSFKYGATLQEKNQSKHPILLRIDKQAGHGLGKSLEKVIAEQADKLAFMFHEMEMAT